jgi:hypothetical protein
VLGDGTIDQPLVGAASALPLNGPVYLSNELPCVFVAERGVQSGGVAAKLSIVKRTPT